MAWQDRDWARLDESERRMLFGAKSLRRRTTRRRRTLLAASALLVGVLGAGYAVGSARPLLHRVGAGLQTAENRTEARATQSGGHGHVIPIGGPTSASYPGRYTIRGRTAAVGTEHSTGAVVLRGRWNNGTWRILERTRTDARGAYSVVARLDRRGVLHLQLETPDGYVATKALRVT